MKIPLPKWIQKEVFKNAGSHIKMTLLKKIYKNRRPIYFVFRWVCVYLLVLIFAKDIETHLTFPWTKYTWIADIALPAYFEKVDFYAHKKRVSWVYIDSGAQKTIFYFHGNGAGLPNFYYDMEYLSRLGYNVMAVEYPGFDGVPWVPYEENLEEATDDFFNEMVKQKNVTVENTVIFGYSVGWWIALDWAKGKSIDRLILMSPFESRYEMAKKSFWVPIQKLFGLPNSFNNMENITTINAPLLVIQGNNDTVIPIAQGKRVWKQSLVGQKYFIELDDVWHNDIILLKGNILKNAFLEFLKTGALQERYTYLDAIKEQQWTSEKAIPSLDMTSDDSIAKFINPETPFQNVSYVPSALVNISGGYISTSKTVYLRKEAYSALSSLSDAFYLEFWKNIFVVSGYRSFDYQAGIKEKWCPDSLCAHAWHSEHQSWLAVDLFETSTQQAFLSNADYKKYFDWLHTNASKYGFVNTYQKWVSIDGYAIEPWHWRYVWIPLANYLMEKNITLGEFYKNINLH